MAVQFNSHNLKLVQFILDLKLNVNACDYQNMTPLHHAVLTNNCELVNMLIEYGADVNAVDKY